MAADTRAPSLVVSERAALADDLVSFGPDAPTILDDWNAQDLLEHLILRERRPDLLVGPHIPLPAIAQWTEKERAKLLEKDRHVVVASSVPMSGIGRKIVVESCAKRSG